MVDWSYDGKAVVFTGSEEDILKEISPFFVLQKIKSLNNQFYRHGFKKDPEKSVWRHEHFVRGRPDLLSNISCQKYSSKPSSATPERKSDTPCDSDPVDIMDTDDVADTVEHLSEQVKKLRAENARLAQLNDAYRVLLADWSANQKN